MKRDPKDETLRKLYNETAREPLPIDMKELLAKLK